VKDEGSRRGAAGVALGLGAYLIWGFFPLYFRALAGVTPAEILAHRILWSSISLFLFVGLLGAFAPVRRAFGSLRTVGALAISTVLISVNWFVFIFAVDTGHVLEASLGYFITPLVNVLLGRLFLGERLRPVQSVAVLLATVGVLVKSATLGQFPVISLILAASFGGYGLVRKKTPVDAVTALTVETALLAPLALLYALYLARTGAAHFLGGSLRIDLLLVFAGVLTAVPLVLYGAAILRLRLATVGILQYLVPTMHFLLAVFAFGEPFTANHLAAFSLIWAGLFIYALDTFRSLKRADA